MDQRCSLCIEGYKHHQILKSNLCPIALGCGVVCRQQQQQQTDGLTDGTHPIA